MAESLERSVGDGVATAALLLGSVLAALERSGALYEQRPMQHPVLLIRELQSLATTIERHLNTLAKETTTTLPVSERILYSLVHSIALPMVGVSWASALASLFERLVALTEAHSPVSAIEMSHLLSNLDVVVAAGAPALGSRESSIVWRDLVLVDSRAFMPPDELESLLASEHYREAFIIESSTPDPKRHGVDRSSSTTRHSALLEALDYIDDHAQAHTGDLVPAPILFASSHEVARVVCASHHQQHNAAGVPGGSRGRTTFMFTCGPHDLLRLKRESRRVATFGSAISLYTLQHTVRFEHKSTDAVGNSASAMVLPLSLDRETALQQRPTLVLIAASSGAMPQIEACCHKVARSLGSYYRNEVRLAVAPSWLGRSVTQFVSLTQTLLQQLLVRGGGCSERQLIQRLECELLTSAAVGAAKAARESVLAALRRIANVLEQRTELLREVSDSRVGVFDVPSIKIAAIKAAIDTACAILHIGTLVTEKPLPRLESELLAAAAASAASAASAPAPND